MTPHPKRIPFQNPGTNCSNWDKESRNAPRIFPASSTKLASQGHWVPLGLKAQHMETMYDMPAFLGRCQPQKWWWHSSLVEAGWELSLSIGPGAQQACGKCLRNQYQGTFRSHWKERVDKPLSRNVSDIENPQNKMSISHLIFLPTDNTLCHYTSKKNKGLLLFILKSREFPDIISRDSGNE